MRILCVIAALAVCVLNVIAETGVSLTIYNQNLALVRDTRKMEFKNGSGETLFKDVSGQIDATSVHFSASGVQLLEQNFDYDLVSPEKLSSKFLDTQIEVVTEEKEDVIRGKLLSAGGQLILQQSDGSLRSILMSAVKEVRYPSLPEGLITRPTLRWLVNANSGGSKETEVSYLTGGISWQSDYVMVLNEKNDAAELAGWVTINNSCGASFKDAKLKLIAGDIHRALPPQQPHYEMFAKTMAADAGNARQFEEQSFFEYHLYTLQRPATVLDNQTKQIQLFPNARAAVKKIYQYDWQKSNDKVSVSAELENKASNNLGMPLPAGKVRVYQESSDGSEEFIGEDQIDHTPKDEKITVEIGNAFDITPERAELNYRQISSRVTERDIQVKLRNHKTEAVEVVVVDNFWGDWEITKSSLEYKKINANKVEFKVSVKPDQEITLTYTVRNR